MDKDRLYERREIESIIAIEREIRNAENTSQLWRYLSDLKTISISRGHDKLLEEDNIVNKLLDTFSNLEKEGKRFPILSPEEITSLAIEIHDIKFRISPMF